MEELIELCQEKGLSFILSYNNHKLFGLTPTQYLKETCPEVFRDEAGLAWVEVMEKRDTIVECEVYDRDTKSRFHNYDVIFEGVLHDTCQSIRQDVRIQSGQWVILTPAPKDDAN